MSHNEHEPVTSLSREDARVVDALLGQTGLSQTSTHDGDRTSREDSSSHRLDERLLAELPESDRARGAALQSLLARLERYPVSDADDALIDATMARIDRVDRDLASLPLAEVNDERRRLRFRVPDFVGLAAAILLAVGVLFPVMHRVRQSSIDALCGANLRLAGQASAAYANDFDGWLPTQAGLLSWDRASSSENLAVLRDLGYCTHGHLDCPGHDGPSVRRSGESGGYAFRSMDQVNRARIGMAPQSALMADRSHVVDYALAGGRVTNLALPSANHGHRGQQVLLGTLEVRWTTSPLIEGVRGGLDNIYLIQIVPGTEDLTPGQRTLSPDDHFTH